VAELQVRNNLEAGRFELDLDGASAVLDYRIDDGRIVMAHTEVPAAHRGRGYGQLLARTALSFAREQSLEVVPLCPFVSAFIKRHPELR